MPRDYVRIEGRIWHYRLYDVDKTRGLFSFYPDTEGKLIVQYEAPPSRANVKRLYSLFDTIMDFRKYISKLPEGDHCFYETILGHRKQKPHFDIDFEGERRDVTRKSKNLLSNLKKAIETVLGLELRKDDWFVFSSHGIKGDHYKRSYHVVIDNYCHINNEEARAFYDRVMTYIDDDKEHIDHAVYGSVQQFRIYGSQKYGSNRPKKCDTHVATNHKETTAIWNSSIIGNTAYCQLLPFYVVVQDKHEFVSNSLSEEGVDELTDLIENHEYTRGMIISDVQGTMVIMRRNGALNECPNCSVVHEAENPFITVDKHGEVWFYCRRNEDGVRSNMGYIGVRNVIEEGKQDCEEETPEDCEEGKCEEEASNKKRVRVKIERPNLQEIAASLLNVSKIDHREKTTPPKKVDIVVGYQEPPPMVRFT